MLAVAPSSRFPAPPESLHRQSIGARPGPNGRTATIIFEGAASGNGPCTAAYTVDQVASNTAVAIRVRETRNGDGTRSACADVG